MTRTLRILDISFSPIENDARVLRQLSVLQEFGEVTTVGYGQIPEGSHHHLQIPTNLPSLPQTIPGVTKLALRRFVSADLSAPALQFAEKHLGGREFDLVVSNDIRAIPLAFKVAARNNARVWADLHEWAPEELTNDLRWRLLVAPFAYDQCRRFLPLCNATSTVSESIAQLYADEFGVVPDVVRNAPQYEELKPSPLDDGLIRLVHSGAAIRGRSLETMIDVVNELGDRFSLDLFLTQSGHKGYIDELIKRAHHNPNIRFNNPVAPQDLPRALNEFDMGIFWLPPFSTNARLAIPNKFFDFIQARLAVGIGPTPDMARITKEANIGVIAAGFTGEQAVRSLRDITSEDIKAWKENTNRIAREMSFQRDADTIRSMITKLMEPA